MEKKEMHVKIGKSFSGIYFRIEKEWYQSGTDNVENAVKQFIREYRYDTVEFSDAPRLCFEVDTSSLSDEEIQQLRKSFSALYYSDLVSYKFL